MESSDSVEAPLVTPGERLRQAREAAGISPREMADRLNWLPAYVGAIEENEFDVLRGGAFVRGYLRGYARALGLDEDEVVALYAAMDPQESEGEQGDGAAAAGGETGGGPGVWIGVTLGLAVIVIAAVWFKQQRTSSPVVETPPAAETVESAPSAPAPAKPEPNGAAEAIVDAPAEVTRDDSTVDETALPVADAPEQSPVADASEPATVEASEPEPEAEPEPATDADPSTPAVLEFSFTGDCWLEVRDAAGQLIYADLREAGDTLRLDGTPPFDILAGDAAALSLTFLGEPVEVQTRPGRDTARFTVGAP